MHHKQFYQSIIFIFLGLFCSYSKLQAQEIIPLYPNGQIPNDHPSADPKIKNIIPTLTVYLAPADKANGTGMVICPGGGYAYVSYQKEGVLVAQALNKIGISAFILSYRLPHAETMNDRTIGPIQDAQQAIKVLRQRAVEWHLNSKQIGIEGFSAGGHLAATASTHFDHAFIPDPEGMNLRPDFSILIYPVISFKTDIMHKGSRDNLLGADSLNIEKNRYFSNELQVSALTPPTFMVHAEDDGGVDVQNSIVYYQALHQYKVPAEIHIYPQGGHGFGLHNATTPDEWTSRLENWLRMNHWIK
jgi:acetyl esterase/lipase